MSVHVTSWVLKHSDERLGNRLVLLVLADKAEEDGTNAWPSVETIARESRMTERQAQRCLRSLEENGSIVRQGRHRKGTQRHGTYVYDVVMKGDNLSPSEDQRVTSPTAKGDIRDIQRVSDMSPELSLEQPSIETPEVLPAAPVAYDPIKGRRIKGHDHPWNALAAETRAVGEINGARMKRALATIRPIVWDFAQARGATPEKVQADPDAYELAVAETITLVARRLAADSPELTWGPEGVARNFAAALARISENGSIQRIANEAVARARARA